MQLKYSDIIDRNTNMIKEGIISFLRLRPNDIKKKISLEITLTDDIVKAQDNYNRLRMDWLDQHATETELDGKKTKFVVENGKETNKYNLSDEAEKELSKKLDELLEQTFETKFERFTEDELKGLNYQNLDFMVLKPFIKFNEV